MHISLLRLAVGILLGGALWAGCHRHRTAMTPPTPAETAIVPDENTPKILFLFLTIKRDSAAQAGATIALTQTQLAPGRLKTPVKIPRIAQPDELVCSFLDAQGAEISAQVVEDPLTASTEYPEENGIMQRTYLYKSEAELFLRVQYAPRVARLRVNKVMPDGTLVQMGMLDVLSLLEK